MYRAKPFGRNDGSAGAHRRSKARRRIQTIEEDGNAFRVRLVGEREPLYWPKSVDLSWLYVAVAEQGRPVTMLCGGLLGPSVSRRGRRSIGRQLRKLGVNVLESAKENWSLGHGIAHFA